MLQTEGTIIRALLVAVILAGCGGSAATPEPTATPSVEYQLAVIHAEGVSDPAVEREFAQILDRILAGGCEGTDDRRAIADTIVASWEDSAQTDSLLDWARALAAVCG